jgi:uncharacterized membrane protein YraQ (UPF0718 family)
VSLPLVLMILLIAVAIALVIGFQMGCSQGFEEGWEAAEAQAEWEKSIVPQWQHTAASAVEPSAREPLAELTLHCGPCLCHVAPKNHLHTPEFP